MIAVALAGWLGAASVALPLRAEPVRRRWSARRATVLRPARPERTETPFAAPDEGVPGQSKVVEIRVYVDWASFDQRWSALYGN